ncbi:hypothetical protein CBS101457_004192 [Exobasidium rhododendri]|nr:hypothetical protein CBS101457_004192 [Exobasidium rhododendri]
MLQSAYPASAVLHPLHTPSQPVSLPNRESFQQSIDQYKASIRSFLDNSTSLYTSLAARPDGEENTSNDSETPLQHIGSKGKKERLVTLLRESSTHSTALSDALHHLLRSSSTEHSGTQYLPVELNACALVTPQDASWPTTSHVEATRALERFVRSCELMARELKMEAFSDEHNGVNLVNSSHTHTLTLAASILVVDVEVGLTQEKEGYWKPVVRLRLSYATDSATTSPRVRDHRLADLLKADLQSVADLLLGWGILGRAEDRILKAQGYYMRVKATFKELKRQDDLSGGLKVPTEGASVPDIFAAMEDFNEKVYSTTEKHADEVKQIKTGLGLPLQHIGWPYSSVVYNIAPMSSDPALSIAEHVERQTLALASPHSSPVYCLSFTIAASTSSSSLKAQVLPPLPDLDIEGKHFALQYVAKLHPAVVMSKKDAFRLSIAAGIDVSRNDTEIKGEKAKLDTQLGPLAAAKMSPPTPSYEDLVSSSDIAESGLRFVPKYNLDNSTKRQGVLITQFPFASLHHLGRVIKILRQQSMLNDLLCDVASSKTSIVTQQEDAEPTLEDILDDAVTEKRRGFLHAGYVTLVEDETEEYAVLINVPLMIDTWTLEVKVKMEGEAWALDAAVSQLGSSQAGQRLQRQSEQYDQCTALLNQRGGKELKAVSAILRSWALATIQSVLSERDEDTIEAGDRDKSRTTTSQSKAERDVVKEPFADQSPAFEPKFRSRRVSQDQRPGTNLFTRRKSSTASLSKEDKEADHSGNTKRRASQASLGDEDGPRRTSRRKS